MNALEQAQALETTNDFSNPTTGGTFERDLPEAGKALFRLQSYIELGTQKPRNPTWTPRVTALFTFELLHPKHLISPEGKPAFPMTLTFRESVSTGANSRFIKLFKKMNYSGEYRHFKDMIGKASWLGDLHHRTVGEGDKKKTYVNLNNEDGEWTIGAPAFVDPLTEKVTDVPVPEMHSEGKLFLWEEASWSDELIKTLWDTLYIETPEDVEKSRNWIQEAVMTAIDWEGSRTQAAVAGKVLDIPTELAAPVEAVKTPVEPAADSSNADALAALGL